VPPTIAGIPFWLHRALLIAAIAPALLAGCKPSGPPSPAAGGRLFGATFQTLDNPVFAEINSGLKTAVESHGDRLVTLDAQFSSQKQKNDVGELLQRHPSAIFINPVNWEGVRGTLIEAKRRDVPVIIVDAPVSDPDLVLCQVASDNFEAGRLACESLAEVKPRAKIVVLHLSVNRACIDRVEGFRAEMARYPGMRVLDTREGKGSAGGARPVMGELLARFPEMDAVFAVNDPSALGAIAAIEAADRAGRIAVVAVDGSSEGVAAIRAGKLHSTSAQSPGEIGRIAAGKAYEHLAGKPVQKDIKIPVKLITAENAASPGAR